MNAYPFWVVFFSGWVTGALFSLAVAICIKPKDRAQCVVTDIDVPNHTIYLSTK